MFNSLGGLLGYQKAVQWWGCHLLVSGQEFAALPLWVMEHLYCCDLAPQASLVRVATGR